MLTNQDLIEHFMIDQNEEILEHYGVPGMRWGVRKSRKTSGSRRKKSSKLKDYMSKRKEKRLEKKRINKERKEFEKEQRRQQQEKRLHQSPKNKKAIKDQRQHVKDLNTLVRDLGKLSDSEVKSLSARLENEAKIIKNTQAIAKSLPPSNAEKLKKTLNTIGEIRVPSPVFDDRGNVTSWNSNGKVKNVIQDAVLNYATSYLKSQGVNVDVGKTVKKASAIKDHVDETTKVFKEANKKNKKVSRPEPEDIDQYITRIRKEHNNSSYTFYPDNRLYIE